MKIAVVGGGPGGCRAAQLLARKGHEVTLIDSQGPWEKPCGGIAAGRRLADLLPAGLDRDPIQSIRLHFDDRMRAGVPNSGALQALSRRQLGVLMHAEAAGAGATIVRERASSVKRRNGIWRIETRGIAHEAEFLVGADGAASFVRRQVSTPLGGEDLNVAVGYLVPGAGTAHGLDLFLLSALEGFAWSLGRASHVAYGLIARPIAGWTAKYAALLGNFVRADLGAEALEQAAFFTAMAPALRPRSWKGNRVAGDGWALVGDAAGLVNPLTGQGIDYALRSAALLADADLDSRIYTARVEKECVPELRRAARIRERLFGAGFRGPRRRKRLVRLSRRSSTLRAMVGSLIAGDQSYVGLGRRIFVSSPRIAWDLASSGLRGPAAADENGEGGRPSPS